MKLSGVESQRLSGGVSGKIEAVKNTLLEPVPQSEVSQKAERYKIIFLMHIYESKMVLLFAEETAMEETDIENQAWDHVRRVKM